MIDIQGFVQSLKKPENYRLFLSLMNETFIILNTRNWDWPEAPKGTFCIYKLHNPIVDSRIKYDKDTICETSVGNLYHLTSLGNHFGYAFDLISGEHSVGENMFKVYRLDLNVKDVANIHPLFSDNYITMYAYSKKATLIVNHLDPWTSREGYYGLKTRGRRLQLES